MAAKIFNAVKLEALRKELKESKDKVELFQMIKSIYNVKW